MMRSAILVLLFLGFIFGGEMAFGQTLLEADGTTDTYELISSKLAPGYNPVEVPDCGHGDFGQHIDQVFDNELNEYVFRFHIHRDEDDDRCIKFDRQRNEIKSYDKSPDSLLAVEGEIFEFKWKFNLDADFQPSPKFTHLHQLKAVGGSEASMPQITLTARAGNPEHLELRYAETTRQITLKEVNLNLFKGVWCQVTERVEFGENGKYFLKIETVAGREILFEYENKNIRMWKTDAEFIRPKWGIYRSLEFDSYLRDEEVLFADFSIKENPDSGFSSVKKNDSIFIQISPNPASDLMTVSGANTNASFQIFNTKGKQILEGKIQNKKIDITGLADGIFFIRINSGDRFFVKKFFKEHH